jgi:hypothetical protein
VLKKADPPVPPVWRAPTVPAVDLLVANAGRVMVPCQDRGRRRRWPKASLYKGPSPGHARPTDGHVGVCPARGCPRETRQSAPGWWIRKMSTPWVHSRERQALAAFRDIRSISLCGCGAAWSRARSAIERTAFRTCLNDSGSTWTKMAGGTDGRQGLGSPVR